ncbi:MAG: hypothetical protein PF589_03735 [Gammaproteobacteria bacterium]|nr:hypothetical protein [Gammaproteobacteria bacterium]
MNNYDGMAHKKSGQLSPQKINADKNKGFVREKREGREKSKFLILSSLFYIRPESVDQSL